MILNDVHADVQKRKLKKRVGRGIGSGHGKTASRGHKGQYASAGAKRPKSTFEGGQTPLFRKIPKRGFSNATWDKLYLVVNIGDIDATFDDGATIDLAELKRVGLAKKPCDGVRILGEGEVTKKFVITANHFSKSATEKLTAAGCTLNTLPKVKKPVKNKMKPRKPKA